MFLFFSFLLALINNRQIAGKKVFNNLKKIRGGADVARSPKSFELLAPKRCSIWRGIDAKLVVRKARTEILLECVALSPRRTPPWLVFAADLSRLKTHAKIIGDQKGKCVFFQLEEVQSNGNIFAFFSVLKSSFLFAKFL